MNLKDYVDFEANLTSVSYGSNVGELVSVDVHLKLQDLLTRFSCNDSFSWQPGKILLQRRGGVEPFVSLVNPADVRADVNRFSVDFAHEQIITGDRIEIEDDWR